MHKILIANRGEIAVRIIRACRDMGLASVAVYSECDRAARHVQMADVACAIGPSEPAESYLRIDWLLDVARRTQADAVHPGYGFLAENAHFAEICRDCKIEFIGPPHQAMAKIGDKVSAREIAIAAKVNVVPGSDGLIENEAEALKVAKEIGYPVLIKATVRWGC